MIISETSFEETNGEITPSLGFDISIKSFDKQQQTPSGHKTCNKTPLSANKTFSSYMTI